jgi:hypothetical protein
MAFELERMAFSAWRTTHRKGLWTDVFILRISPSAGLPPWAYAVGIRRLAALLIRKRPEASLWVQLDGPGRWYLQTMRAALGWRAKLPIAISPPSSLPHPDRHDYLVLPWLSASKPQAPVRVATTPHPCGPVELACLQVLARIERGSAPEVASLSGIEEAQALAALESLTARNLIAPQHGKEAIWQLRHKGLSMALRSWGIPIKAAFACRKERALSDPDGEHRRISRLWPGWLRAAWPQVDIWAGWSEAGLPGLAQTPDGLAWGRMAGVETLFWLEVESGHDSREGLRRKIRRRFVQAVEYVREQEMALVFALLGRAWVCEAVRPAFVNIPDTVAVVLGNWREPGHLPLTEWGRVEW